MQNRKKIIPLLLLLFSCSFKLEDEASHIQIKDVRTSYYSNGKLEYSSEMYNGKLDGVTKYWDNRGKLKSFSSYKNGDLHGKSIFYFEDGSVKLKSEYFYGKKHGIEEAFYNNGQRQSYTVFEYGEVLFPTSRWTSDGELIP